MSVSDGTRTQTGSFPLQSRYDRVQQALAGATDENVRLWLAAAEHAAVDAALPAAARVAALDHAVACRDLLARRNGGSPHRVAATDLMPDGS